MATAQNFTSAIITSTIKSTDMGKQRARSLVGRFTSQRFNDSTFNAIVKSVPFLHQKPH
jgi:hypothetical protein